MAPELDAKRLQSFATRVGKKRPRKQLRRDELWSAFGDSFPNRPQGAEEIEWFLAALKAMEERNLIKLPPASGKRWEVHLKIRVPTSVDLVPLESETKNESWRDFPWHPRLAWASNMEKLSEEHERFLTRIHDGLVNGSLDSLAPMKYRSLQLTGNEKRLKGLSKGSLFGSGRLSLKLIGCLPEITPLAWESVSDKSTVLVFENAGPFIAARNVLSDIERPPYGVIAYGAGKGFLSSLKYLESIGRTITDIAYVGDIDMAGPSLTTTLRQFLARN